ncbi:MAG TPA: histidinol-phosphate transaminase [Acidobacteriaceae bacterium]|jgi:histidinol-phosphate aminotransferase|nr:histidinol-phosphate transaminase [Acidobacteriaceae bacterium]
MSNNQTVTARKLVTAMPEYHPPLAGRDLLRLDFNENTFAPSPKVMARLAQLTADGMTKYPERETGERAAAAYYGLAPAQVLLTNGVDEAIHLLCAAYLEPEDEAIIATPGFFMYDVSISMMTSHLKRVQSDESLQFPFERVLAAITPRTKAIILSSPNNPTGAVIPRAQVLQICAAAPQAVVMMDEAYFHFHGETAIADIATTPNLLIARTFSKAYGLANLRIGVALGQAALIAPMRKVASPYNVNGIALDCLPVALADEAYVQWYAKEVLQGRERMEQALTQLGVSFWKSHANFILMKIGSKHKELVIAMRKHGVLVRDRSNDPGCEGNVRITIGIADHVTRGIEALTASLAEIGWKPE